MDARTLPSPVARWTLGLIVALTACNAVWCLAGSLYGWRFAAPTFLGDPADRYADFFKVALSYPGTRPFASADTLGLRTHLLVYMMSGYDPRSPLVTAHAFTVSDITHFHLTPLTTLLAIGAGHAMRWIEPALLLLAAWSALTLYAAYVVTLVARTRLDRCTWFVGVMISYPMLLVWDRGNLFAGFAGLALLHALLLGLLDRRPYLAAILLALAIQIRPNIALLLLPLLLWSGRRALRLGLLTGAVALIVALAALALVHRVYALYAPATMLAGLDRYYQLYVVGDGGLAFGSSLLGAMKLLIGFHPGLETLAAAFALAVVAAALLLRDATDRPTTLFLLAAGTTLGSAVFADYHLVMFLIVPMAWGAEGRSLDRGSLNTPGGIALMASWAMLVPKNYIFQGPVSAQVLVNPLLLVVAATVILAMAFHTTMTKKAARCRTALPVQAGSRRLPG